MANIVKQGFKLFFLLFISYVILKFMSRVSLCGLVQIYLKMKTLPPNS